MKLSEHQRIFTHHIGQLIMFAYSQGMELTLGHAWRSLDEQKRLLAEGKSQTLKSKHLDRLAVDFNLFVDGALTWDWEDYKVLGEYWVKLDEKNRWGGSWDSSFVKKGFVDSVHFERNI